MGGANGIVLSSTLLPLFCVLDLVNLPCCIEWDLAWLAIFVVAWEQDPGLGNWFSNQGQN